MPACRPALQTSNYDNHRRSSNPASPCCLLSSVQESEPAARCLLLIRLPVFSVVIPTSVYTTLLAMMSRASQRQLCTFCQGINLEDLKSARGYVHQPTGGALIESGEDCHLCQLLVDSFTRCIYEQHLAQYSIRQISDVRHLGPVSLFAASRDLDSNEHFFQRRTKNVVRDRVLSRRVAVTLGVVDTDLPSTLRLDVRNVAYVC